MIAMWIQNLNILQLLAYNVLNLINPCWWFIYLQDTIITKIRHMLITTNRHEVLLSEDIGHYPCVIYTIFLCMYVHCLMDQSMSTPSCGPSNSNIIWGKYKATAKLSQGFPVSYTSCCSCNHHIFDNVLPLSRHNYRIELSILHILKLNQIEAISKVSHLYIE